MTRAWTLRVVISMPEVSEREEPIYQYVRPHHMDKLNRLGYITDEEREEMQNVGVLTVENADGDDVFLCPDMWEAPKTVKPIIRVLGNRNDRSSETGDAR